MKRTTLKPITFKSIPRAIAILTLAIAALVASVALHWPSLHWPAASLAQTSPPPRQLPPSTAELWRRAYEQLPDLPKENHYINRETKQPEPNNTLLSRLMRYHIYILGRSPFYRLDWKITLADYLGVHRFIPEEGYPGSERLTVNPLSGDVAVVRSLTRRQRDRLATVLASLFNPRAALPEQPSTREPEPEPSPTRPVNPPPGGADLLRP